MCRLATNGGGDAAATSALAEANSRLQLGTSKAVFHIYLLGAHVDALNKKWEWEGLKSPFVKSLGLSWKASHMARAKSGFRLRTSYAIFPCQAKRERTSPLWVNMVMLSGHKMNMHKFYNDQLQFRHALVPFDTFCKGWLFPLLSNFWKSLEVYCKWWQTTMPIEVLGFAWWDLIANHWWGTRTIVIMFMVETGVMCCILIRATTILINNVQRTHWEQHSSWTNYSGIEDERSCAAGNRYQQQWIYRSNNDAFEIFPNMFWIFHVW